MSLVITIKCTNCEHEFAGYLQGPPSVNLEYSAECPLCRKVASFPIGAEWIDDVTPVDAVKIYSKQN